MKVTLFNFMKHKDLVVSFGAFNIITGENGAGKSSIFHAINWCIEGGTNNHITYGEKDSSVSIEYEGDTYTRQVKKGKYSVLHNGKEICTTKEGFKELGISLPLEFYNQFNKLFLLHETPKVKTDMINEVFQISELENSLGLLKKDIKDYEDTISSLEIAINKSQHDIDTLLVKEYLLEAKIKEVDESSRLCAKFDKVKMLQDRIKPTPSKIIKDIDSVEMFNKLAQLVDLRNKIKPLPKLINKDVDDIIVVKLNGIKFGISVINSHKESITQLKLELNEINNNLKGERCPLCQSKIH